MDRQIIYKSNCYNTLAVAPIKQKNLNKIKQPNSIPVLIDGKKFLSISEAARFYKVTPSTMRHRLNNPDYKTWAYANPTKRSMISLARPVVVGGTYSVSVSMAAAKEGVNDKTVCKNIKTKTDWVYFDQLNKTSKMNISNLDQ